MQRLIVISMRFMSIIFWMLIVIVTVLMLIELKPTQGGLPNIDKVEHALVFTALGVSGSLAYAQKRHWVYLGLVALGALYELLQALFTVTRQASVYDWLADIAGILIAIGLMTYFSTLCKQNNSLKT